MIIANDRYDNDGLEHLRSPGADAEALGRVLSDPQIGAFEVQIVRNEPAHIIAAHVESLFKESRPDDVVLVHFSCHGLKSESGELFFAASGTRPDLLGSTAVSADFVQRCMRTARSRTIVLLLDCCYGGAFSQGVTVRASGDVNVLDSFPDVQAGGGQGRAVITASSALEFAFEGDRLADDKAAMPSVFTSALVEGLESGDADRDEDGLVSLNELYDYVWDRVRERNPHQTPSRDGQISGQLFIARSRRRRLRALPIPGDLQAATTDGNMFTRIGAVTELRSRLLSDNLPVALGALEALREIVASDIRYVADAASAAIGDASMQVSASNLNFGPTALNNVAGTKSVQLIGPPLGRVCTIDVSADWIQVVETDGGLLISVDTGRAGRYRGVVAVHGLVGDANIDVALEVTDHVKPEPVPVSPSASAQPSVPAVRVVGPTKGMATPAEGQATSRGSWVPSSTLATDSRPSTTGTASTVPDTLRSETPAAKIAQWPWAGITAFSVFALGLAAAALGVLVSTVGTPVDKWRMVGAHLVLYVVLWLIISIAPSERQGLHRVVPILIWTYAVYALTQLYGYYLPQFQYSMVTETPLYLFWLVAGGLELIASAMRRTPTVAVECLVAVLTIAFGASIVYLDRPRPNDMTFVVSYGYFIVVTGCAWVTIGAQRIRSVVRADGDR